MASINLVVEQVNHRATDIEVSDAKTDDAAMDNALNAVVDAHTDFIRRTPAVNDGLSDDEDEIEEDRTSSADTVTEAEASSSEEDANQKTDLPMVHKESVKYNENHTPRSITSTHNDEGISDMAYPQISYPVAQYLFESNPRLTEKMEQILVSGGSSQSTTPSQSANASPAHRKSSKSSLASLSSMTDALRLQNSAIGNAKVPAASPEEVALAINKIQEDKKQAAKRYQKTQQDLKSEPNSPTLRSAEPRPKDLVPYPPERITKVVEKSQNSWFNNRKSSDSDQISNSVDSGYSPLSEDKIQGNHDKYMDKMETMSNISNFSERLEVMSNISGVSGIEEEMYRIRKFLVEVPQEDIKVQLSNQSVMPPREKLEQLKVSPKKEQKIDVKSVGTDASFKENKEVVFKYQKEIANLEGQIEVMQSEMECTVEEKARMQATIASLQTQLKAQITSTQTAMQEKDMAEQEVEKVAKTTKDYNGKVKELQSNIEQQIIENKMLKEELDESENVKAKLKIASEELRLDLETRDGVVEGLKKKIAELHVGLQTMHQTNIQIQNDQSSMKSEVAALNKSKAWYQHQLHTVQEERGQLQQTLMESQTQVLKYVNDVERLKCDGVHMKQQLTETQHRAVREKEVLMHHLETIEADLLEREITFNQLQQDRGSTENGLIEKLKKLEEEKSRLNTLVFNVSDLSNQLDVAKADIQTRDLTIEGLERDRLRALKDVTVKDKDLNSKNLLLKQVENQLRETDLKVKQLQIDLTARNEQYNALKTEKTNMEVALMSANNEKKEISEALASFKMNLSKVESNFKQMKAEVVTKTTEMEKLQRDKDRIQASMEQVEQSAAIQRQEFESQVCMDSQQRGLIVSDLKRQKTELEKVLTVLKIDLHKSQSDHAQIAARNNELELHIKDIANKYNEMNNTLHGVVEEKQFLEGRLQAREKQALIKGSSVDNDLYKNRAKELQQTLDQCQAEFSEKQRVYKSNVKVLMKKLRQLRERAEKEMKMRIEVEKLEIMNGDLGDADEMKVLNDRLNKEIEDYKLKLTECEDNLENMTSRYEQQKLVAEQNQKLVLALEKEKGRLAGVTQNHSALKQHTSHLEATLAQRESVVSELDYVSKEIAEKQRCDEAKLHEKIISLEDLLNREKNSVKELRKQLFQDKRENSNLKRHLNSMMEGLESANQIGDQKKMDILKLKSELDLKVQAELKHRSEIEAMHTELKKTQAEIQRLNRAVEESHARDPVLTQQMKTLSWHLKQKNEELVGLKEQLRLLKETHNTEMKAVQSLLQNAEAVGEQMKMELAQVRKEKFTYQAKVNDLRTALKTSCDHNKKFVEKFNELQNASAASISETLRLPESPSAYDDSYINQLLEQSSSIPQTRPLSNLKTCLTALKTEVNELMKQLQDEETSHNSNLPISSSSAAQKQHLPQSNGVETI